MLGEGIVERLAGHEQPGEQHGRADLGEQRAVGRRRDITPGGGPGDDGAEHLALGLEDLLPDRVGELGVAVHRAEEPEDQRGVPARQAGAHGLKRRLQVRAQAAGVGRGSRGLAGVPPDGRDHQRRLIRPPPVDGGLAAPGPRRHCVDSQLVEAELGQQLERGLQDRALPRRAATAWCRHPALLETKPYRTLMA